MRTLYFRRLITTVLVGVAPRRPHSELASMISHSVVEPTISDFYSSYLSWNWPGWKLARQDGRTYFFPDGGAVQRPEQGALIAVHDASGNSLRLQRDSTGNLQRAGSGFRWIQFKYDSHYRMTGAQENNGREFVYRYNTDGCLEEVEDADHHITKYGHEGARCPTSMAIDGGPVWSAQFDESDRVKELELADAGTSDSYTL